jgi:hypothetical protein
LGVRAQEALALGERDGMGRHAADLAQGHAGQGDQVVHDPHHDLARDRQIVLEQEVVILDDGAGERVLERHHGRVGDAADDRREHLVELAAGHGRDVGAEEAPSGVLAERAVLALECGLEGHCAGERILYPTWRTVSIMSPPGPSLARWRRTWMSTVRVFPV